MSWSLVAAVGLALLLGGDFRRLSSVKIRAWWLLAAALALKLALLIGHAPPTWWAQPLIFGLVAAGAVANWRLPGVALVGGGLLLNAAVVAANGGVMPFSPAAFRLAGLPPAQTQVTALSRPEDGARLVWLDDRIPFPPTKQVLSAGDVAIMAGGLWLVIGLTRVRATKNPEAAAAASGF